MRAATRPWHDPLPTVTAEVDCGGQEHRITWRRGKLVLENHDVLAERSLAALGAKLPLCIEILDAWRRMRGIELLYDLLFRERTLSPEELVVRKAGHEAERARLRGHPASLGAPPGSEMRNRLESQAAEWVEREDRMWAMTLLEALPGALRRVLALSVIVQVARHWHDEGFRREHGPYIEYSLTAITAPLFEQSARRWRRNLKPYAGFVAESWLLAPGKVPTCAAWADSGGAYGALSLPVSWFTDVWARGIALVDGCFVLGLAERPRDHKALRVLALRWERQDREISRSVAAPAVLTRGKVGDWRLRWANDSGRQPIAVDRGT